MISVLCRFVSAWIIWISIIGLGFLKEIRAETIADEPPNPERLAEGILTKTWAETIADEPPNPERLAEGIKNINLYLSNYQIQISW